MSVDARISALNDDVLYLSQRIDFIMLLLRGQSSPPAVLWKKD